MTLRTAAVSGATATGPRSGGPRRISTPSAPGPKRALETSCTDRAGVLPVRAAAGSDR